MTPEERLEKLREQLQQVEKAIQAIQNGAQEYRIGSRMLRRPDLNLLYSERDRLEAEIAALEQGNGIFRVAVFDGR
jgi:conjugal transfer/entry exclusion protein